MSGGLNTSQDPDYEGPTGYERRFYKTHFGVLRDLRNRRRVQDDPNWVYLGAGRWKYIPKETRETRRAGAED